MDESSLSGEVEPVLKSCEKVARWEERVYLYQSLLIRKENMSTSEMVNTAFMGTMVVTGRAQGLVVSTGEKTQFGQVRLYMVVHTRVPL